MSKLREFLKTVRDHAKPNKTEPPTSNNKTEPPKSQPGSPKLGPAPVLQSLKIEPASATLAAETTQQFKATAVYADGSTNDVTGSIDWLVNDLAILTIDDKGVATALKQGKGEVTAMDAESGVTSNSAIVTVTAQQPPAPVKPEGAPKSPVLESIAIEPDKVYLLFDEKQQLKVTGWYSDDSSADLTKKVQWHLEQPVVKIDANGVATARPIEGHLVLVKAIDPASGIFGQTWVSVNAPEGDGPRAPVLESIGIEPNQMFLIFDQTQQLKVTGRYTDKSSQDLTKSVQWEIEKPVVVIDANGLATAQHLEEHLVLVRAIDPDSGVAGQTWVTVNETETPAEKRQHGTKGSTGNETETPAKKRQHGIKDSSTGRVRSR